LRRASERTLPTASGPPRSSGDLRSRAYERFFVQRYASRLSVKGHARIREMARGTRRMRSRADPPNRSILVQALRDDRRGAHWGRLIMAGFTG